MPQPSVSRRRFLTLAAGSAATAGTVGGLALVEELTESVSRAQAQPRRRGTGTLGDLQHIVVLMQENRSFDHLFGTLRGVRGFGDPHPITLPSGSSVWHLEKDGVPTLPFRPDHRELGLAFLQDVPHGWSDTHAAWADGRWDGWVAAKGPATMAHFRRADLAFHFALADAFTVLDGYHCSLLGSTYPNRSYLWTGAVAAGTGDGDSLTGSSAGHYRGITYPERLQQAGVSWKVYQDVGDGLDAAGRWGKSRDPFRGNFGDNLLLHFDHFRAAGAGDPLVERADTGTRARTAENLFDQLRADVTSGRLPQISWIVAPEAFSEHPTWPVGYGAWYTSRVLDALTANPDVWAGTALLVTYDEGGGFFDHVVPPTPNTDLLPGASSVSTRDEVPGSGGSAGTPYGLGVRVPMVVVSPWSTGGWVCSQTFDHTSIIRLMEARFGVVEPNITPWRRAVCGDLTAAFDFTRPGPAPAPRPGANGYAPPDRRRHHETVARPPAVPQLPGQEHGVRPSRPLEYAIDVDGRWSARGGAAGSLSLTIRNAGRLGVQLHGRASGSVAAPFNWTVGARTELVAAVGTVGEYDVSVHGPSGFFRRWAGPAAAADADGVEVTSLAGRGTRRLELTLTATASTTVTLTDGHTGSRRPIAVRPGRPVTAAVALHRTAGWYDVTLTGRSGLVRQLAGRVETGHASTSDPLLSR